VEPVNGSTFQDPTSVIVHLTPTGDEISRFTVSGVPTKLVIDGPNRLLWATKSDNRVEKYAI